MSRRVDAFVTAGAEPPRCERVRRSMARHLIILSVIVGLIAAPICLAQPLQAPQACPMKTRCCRMAPSQPADALKPQPPQVAVVHAQPQVVAAMPPLMAGRAAVPALLREVPTRTVVLRI